MWVGDGFMSLVRGSHGGKSPSCVGSVLYGCWMLLGVKVQLLKRGNCCIQAHISTNIQQKNLTSNRFVADSSRLT